MPALDSNYFAAVPVPPPLANNLYYQDLLDSPVSTKLMIISW